MHGLVSGVDLRLGPTHSCNTEDSLFRKIRVVLRRCCHKLHERKGRRLRLSNELSPPLAHTGSHPGSLAHLACWGLPHLARLPPLLLGLAQSPSCRPSSSDISLDVHECLPAWHDQKSGCMKRYSSCATHSCQRLCVRRCANSIQ